MTPQPQRYPRDYPARDAGRERATRPDTSLKVEAVKYIVAMVVAALTSYFATVYAIKEEVAVLKVHVEYMRKEIDKQTKAIESLTAAIEAHTSTHARSQP